MPAPSACVREAAWSRVVACALACAALAPGTAAAAPPAVARLGHVRFDAHGADEGVPLDMVVGVQDREGHIWAASPNGLFRYDGARFRRFSTEDGLPSSLLTDMAVAPDGVLWGATSRGLFRVVGDRIEAIGVGQVPTDGVHLLGFDVDGRTWVTTTAGPLRQVGPDRFELAPGWPGGESFGLLIERDGAMWIGSGARLLRRAADGRFEDLGQDFVEPVTALVRDRAGRLWARAGRHVWVQPRAGAPFVDRGRPDLAVGPTNVRMALSATGDVLVPTANGLFEVVDDELRPMATDLPGDDANVRAVWLDHEGSLWLTSLGLHHQLGRGLWRTITVADGLPGNNVWSVIGLADGRVAVGTDLGIALIDGDRIERATQRSVVALVEVPAGVLWAAGQGLERHDLRGGTVVTTTLDTAGELGAPTSLAVDGHGGLWIGGERGGLYHVADPERPELAPVVIPGSDGARAWSIAVDGDRLLVATSRGLYVRTGDAWRRFAVADGLRDDVLTSVAVRRDHQVCVTYLAPVGLTCARVDSAGLSALRHLDEHTGLNSPVPYFVDEDRAGRLWVGGAAGVTVVGPDGVDHFTRGGGAPGDDCNAGASWVAPDGTIWIGTSTGLGVFDSSRYRPPPPPRVTVTRARLGGTELGRDPARAPGRSVPYGHADLDVELAVVSFLDSRQLEYQVRLYGFDDDWRPASARDARYHRLPAGNYRFAARARYRGGGWGPATSFEVVVLAPWWQTWWFRAAVGGGLVLVVLAIVRWRSRTLVRRNLELEETVRERTHELVRANERVTQVEKLSALGRLLAQLSHEINNPLNVVQNNLGPLEEYARALRIAAVTARALVTEPAARARLDALWVEHDVAYVIDDVDQGFAITRQAIQRIGSINAELKTFMRGEPPERALVQLAPGLRVTAAMFARSAPGVEVSCNLPALPPLLVHEGRIQQTITNLMQNAVDAMGGQGCIAISAEVGPREVRLRVTDSGPGVPPEVRGRMFEPFFTTKEVGKGLGMGLAICREIVKSHGGSLELEERAGPGASFVLTLPVPQAARRAA